MIRDCVLTSVALVLTSTCALSQTQFADWYPGNINPPAGHNYPCAVTALPRDLSGIPVKDRQFINHVYSMLLKALQAKLIMIDTLMQEHQAYGSTYARYYQETIAARQKIMAEPVPQGLEGFRNAVVNAIDMQGQFFAKATKARQSGKSGQDVLAIPEGRTASQLLQTAWGQMQGRYPGMSKAMSDSTYHHLCALDLF